MDLSEGKYNLTKQQFYALTRATLQKIQNAGNVRGPESKLLFAVFEKAVLDALKLGDLGMKKCDKDANHNSAKQFLGSQNCAHYLGLVGIDYQWAMGKVARLMRIAP